MLDFVLIKNDDLDLFISVIWAVWNHCNNLRLGRPVVPLNQLLQVARDKLQDHAFLSVSPPLNRPEQSPAAWTPSSTSYYKINFDGATFDNDGNASLGVVIRNGDGQVIASLSQLVLLPLIVIDVEALAARRGVELALELGFNSVELEGDLTGLINTFMDGCKSLAHYGHIVADIHYLASQFSIFDLSHVRRHCNTAAHSLVRRGILPPPPFCLSRWKMYLKISLIFFMLISAIYLNILFCKD